MSVGIRLELRQSQQLVMTPQLQQAIRLLQMSNVELSDFLAAEVEKNPLLALEQEAPVPTELLGAAGEVPAPGADDGTTVDAWLRESAGPSLGVGALDGGTENLYDPGEPPIRGRSAAGETPEGIEPPAPRPGLRAHLEAEIGLRRAPPRIAALARLLAGELDPDGYLRADTDALADAWGATGTEMEAAIALLQSCEPTGIGARSLAECLSLQLAERGRLDGPMRALLDNLELLARGDLAGLGAAVGVDHAGLAAMLAELRRLDPRPGLAFTAEEPATRVPDILVRPAPEGGWQVELNPETLPRLVIDRSYVARLGRPGGAARRFLAECRASARWLERSLDQRARTLLTVATAVFRHQEGFLERGVGGLVPLTRRQIAEELELHESTVSRAASGKFVATPRGILELGFFFTNALGGDGPTATAVRARIAELIAAEPADAVLSDDAIVARLKEEGIEIARRTVAKYRMALGIPSATERRRHRRLVAGAARAAPRNPHAAASGRRKGERGPY